MSENIVNNNIKETNMSENIDELISEPTPLSIEDIEALLAQQFPPKLAAEPFAGDDKATWTYWTYRDTAERGVPDEWVWERLRNYRNQLISNCDWRVVLDASWDIEPWIEYRQLLRDLPSETVDPRQALWPEPPQ